MSTGAASPPQAPRPLNLVAELTYHCPLRCSYCSNPLEYRDVRNGLDADAWGRVFREAASLGVVHVGLTGGEPSTRADLTQIVAAAAEAGLYTHLVTAGTPLDEAGLAALCQAGLRSVQLSFQDSEAEPSDAVAGVTAFDTKLAFAGWVRARTLALSLNFVLHRHNLERVAGMIELARRLDADRVELANTQYHGWAWLNREALLPRREQIEEAARAVERARAAGNRPEIVFVLPDYFSDRPKPCMGGWGRRTLVVAPDGRVLPCHAARSIPGLEFWSANQRSLEACWAEAPGMQAFRGEAWMPEPCRSCDLRAVDFGGCRCQAYAITGDAGATDPACALAPQHHRVLDARRGAASGAPRPKPRHRGEAIGPDPGERAPAGA
jgi:pyrroloquinoline quinone biosynthesis protein E